MKLLKDLLFLIVLLFISGCSDNAMFISNDNYTRADEYYFDNLYLSKKEYKFITIFNKDINNNVISSNLNIISNKEWKKNDVYVMIFFNNKSIGEAFSKIDNIYSFLKKYKRFKNKFYVIGINSYFSNNNEYKGFIYFKNK